MNSKQNTRPSLPQETLPNDGRCLPPVVQRNIRQVGVRMVPKIHDIAAQPTGQNLKVVDRASGIDFALLETGHLIKDLVNVSSGHLPAIVLFMGIGKAISQALFPQIGGKMEMIESHIVYQDLFFDINTLHPFLTHSTYFLGK